MCDECEVTPDVGCVGEGESKFCMRACKKGHYLKAHVKAAFCVRRENTKGIMDSYCDCYYKCFSNRT